MLRWIAIFALPLVCQVGDALAQQVTIATPRTSVQNNFTEQMGFNFGFNLKGGRLPRDDSGRSSVVGIQPNGMLAPGGGIGFQQGGFGAARPPFGGFQPQNNTTGGIRASNNGNSFNLGFSGGQASSQTRISETPMVTTFNGQPGQFSSQIQQPFVSSVTPVVNNWTPGAQSGYGFRPPQIVPRRSVNPILERYQRLKRGDVVRRSEPDVAGTRATTRSEPRPRMFGDQLRVASESTAGRPALSVAEIRRQQAAVAETVNEEALSNYRRGVAAERQGKTGVAKIYYRMTERDATGELQERAAQRLRALSEKRSGAY